MCNTDHCNNYEAYSRRDFLNKAAMGIGGLALASLLNPASALASPKHMAAPPDFSGGVLDKLHFVPRAKRVIYLFQSGGPSQMETFDYKPELAKRFGENLPPSVRGNQRLTGMSSGQSSFPVVGSPFGFAQYRQNGT